MASAARSPAARSRSAMSTIASSANSRERRKQLSFPDVQLHIKEFLIFPGALLRISGLVLQTIPGMTASTVERRRKKAADPAALFAIGNDY